MITYIATNTTNGKFYIGSTTNFETRKKAHFRAKESYPFQNALRKNPEAFEWQHWEDDSDQPLLEQALLDMWFGKECCYNLNPFADRGPDRTGQKQPPEFGPAHAEKMRGRKNPLISVALKGRKRSEEVKAKIGAGNKGKVRTQEVKDRISATLTGTSWGSHSQGHRDRMSELHSGENNPAFGRKWWVNELGETKYQVEPPGPNWKNGRRWQP